MTNESPKSLKLFIHNVVPEYIRNEFSGDVGDPSYELFLGYFFDFLDEQEWETGGDTPDPDETQDNLLTQNPYNIIRNLVSISDIDQTYKEFLLFFKEKYASKFPIFTEFDVLENKGMDFRRLVKRIRDFYISKGTNTSLDFFFRAAYNEGVDVYLPKLDILRVSDGKWDDPYLIRLETIIGSLDLTNDEYNEIYDTSAIGLTSGATAFVSGTESTNIENAVENPDAVVWARLSGLRGIFVEGEQVQFKHNVTGSLIATYRIKTTSMTSDQRYRGAWKNSEDYRIGDIVFDSGQDFAEDGRIIYTSPTPSVPGSGDYFVCKQPHKSVGFPVFKLGNEYHRSDYVKRMGVIYRAKPIITGLADNTSPLTSPNWTFKGFGSGTAWVGGDEYTISRTQEPVEVEVSGKLFSLGVSKEKIKRLDDGQLTDSQSTLDVTQYLNFIDSDIEPSDNMGCWDVVTESEEMGYTISSDEVPDWSSSVQWKNASVVLYNGKIYKAISERLKFVSNIEPQHNEGIEDNKDWLEIDTDTTPFSGTPFWSPTDEYNSGDVVQHRIPSDASYRKYVLKAATRTKFIATKTPDIDTKNWKLTTEFDPFGFEAEYLSSTKWELLDSGIKPENVGISDGRVKGRWLNNDGKLNSDKRIQDSYFYQDFSYQIKTGIHREIFEKVVYENFHPTGLRMFNSVDEFTTDEIEMIVPEPVTPMIVINIETTEFDILEIDMGEAQSFDVLELATNPMTFAYDYSTVEYFIEDGLFPYSFLTIDPLPDPDLEDPMAEFDLIDFETNKGSNNVLFFIEGKKVCGFTLSEVEF